MLHPPDPAPTPAEASDPGGAPPHAGDHAGLYVEVRAALTLAGARAVAAAAEAEARRNGWAVSVAVVDGAGGLLYFQRMDGTTNASVEVAIGKARHAADYRRPTRFHEELLAGGNTVVLGLPRVVPVEGGLPLVVGETTVGGIGVSGVQSRDDGRIAAAGAAVLLPTP